MSGNITDELCKVCDGRVECAPTAILLISLIHTLYGHIGPEPDYFGTNKKHIGLDPMREEEEVAPTFRQFKYNKWVEKEKMKEKAPNSEFDFIIIGGGTAGCVLASRLSENTTWKVLLIEAGPEEPKIALIPGLSAELWGSSLDWNFSMRPKKGFCQNRGEKGCEVAQGRVLGGTSVINDMAYMRGSPVDYDEWELAGNEGWDYDNVLPYFKYSEGNYDRDVAKNTFFHSTQGPLDVGRYPYVDVNVDVLLSALDELGYNYTNINGKTQLGFMRVQTMSYFGERVSTYTAFIQPIRKMRTNLKIITEALVVKILFEEYENFPRAVGVEYLYNGVIFRAYASKEVILSAGAINTPKILMLSGVGPKDYLNYLGIKAILNLPVGSNFHDHVGVCMPVLKTTKTATTSKFTEKLKDIITYYSKGIGPFSANFQVVAFLETKLSEYNGVPDIEVRFKGHGSNMYYDKMDLCISLLSPKSRGQILLNASNPTIGKPLIYPNFLKEQSDGKRLIEGIQQILNIFDTEVFRLTGVEFDPKLLVRKECEHFEAVSEEFWYCIIQHFSTPMHNYVGSCKMGSPRDPESVVDSQLRVYNVIGLRIVDASIIPKVTRGSTAAPVIMIAERGSDFIKASWY